MEKPRSLRADGQLKMEALLEAASKVFASSGVDAPVREIAEAAGVGIGTVYRHFPQRSDLIVAVFQNQVDACADAAPIIAERCDPGEALNRWIQCYVEFLVNKRGLATALHSGDSAYSALPTYFSQRLEPALKSLLESAIAAGVVRSEIKAGELLRAIGSLCCQDLHGEESLCARRMVGLLVDGLRFGANSQGDTSYSTLRSNVTHHQY